MYGSLTQLKEVQEFHRKSMAQQVGYSILAHASVYALHCTVLRQSSGDEMAQLRAELLSSKEELTSLKEENRELTSKLQEEVKASDIIL